MAARLNILSVLSLILLAVPVWAQQANEQLDSIINALELKEVVVTAKKSDNLEIQFLIRQLHIGAKTIRRLKTFCARCPELK